MGETNEESEERVEERSNTQAHETRMRWRAQTLEPMSCDITLWVRTNTRKKWRVRCTVYTSRRLQQIAISCNRSCYNKFFKKKKKWGPPVFIPLPPWRTGRRNGCHLWYWWKWIGSGRSSPDSRWRRFIVVTAVRKSDRSLIGAFFPDLFSEI